MRKPSDATRARIARMATLPVFWKMDRSRVLLVGNTDGLAWKLELVAASGAHITLLTIHPSEELLRVALEHEADIEYRAWEESDFAGKVLAIADMEDDEAAFQFSALARVSNVPVNVIDRPFLCTVQFGSIVNRSPVVVSISTDGAAPILGQEIRRRIETVLPTSLAEWGRTAKVIRCRLEKFIPDGAVRRAFWRDMAEAVFSGVTEPASWTEARLQGATASVSPGRVTLVGAGPGDAEYLTIKAVRALQSADIILFDDLVSDDVLELARREAKRMLVGKRGGRASCKQDDINALMVKLASQGKHVVRLKSGDPMIFGRAGEEISILRKAGIEVDVVPGISAAMAAASRLGISLTHRDCAQAVKFITAHSRKGVLPDLDWRACADRATTLMVYMGAATAPGMAAKLIEEGMDGTTPVVIAKGIARSTEEITTCQLTDLETMGIDREQPVLIGIGKVFSELADAMEEDKGSDRAQKMDAIAICA